jgi:type III pantothenate kinase
MNLVIDIGNSAIKAAVFEENRIITRRNWNEDTTGVIHEILDSHPGIHNAIISSSGKQDPDLNKRLESLDIHVVILDKHTPLPIINLYRSNETLGRDRIAAAVGGNTRFRGKNLLVIDAGTAITIDFISSGNEYLGGNISPGLSMRFRALHDFTENLPLVETGIPGPSGPGEIQTAGRKDGDNETDPGSNFDNSEFGPGTLLGDDTHSAILNGVVNGIVFEMDEYINRQKSRYPDLETILTGGDAVFFDKKLKNSIFVDLELVLHGLHRILVYNVER